MSIRTHGARRTPHHWTVASLVGVFALLAACESQPTALEVGEGPSFSETSPSNRALAGVRAATSRFHDVNVALAAGYQSTVMCVSNPAQGAMGIHFVNYPLLMDASYSSTEPEVLLYEPQADGSLRLVGVEYLVVQDAWHGAGNTGVPTFGGQPFDAMPAGPDTPAMYALHAWVWRNNPSGTFAPFNPKVSCPTGSPDHSH